ncbi:MAG: hypothetical protein F6K58_31795 [Symploca sp. SIO2E9]|nr:hypothetical protein [Symploca sp. SIO2E9]
MVAQLLEKPQVATNSRIANLSSQRSEYLSPEEAENLELGRKSARNDYNRLRGFIGYCYALMLGERKVLTKTGELTFRDICRQEDYWGYSEASCYRIGQAFVEQRWFFEEIKDKRLQKAKKLNSNDKITSSAFLKLKSRIEDPELKIEVLETAANEFVTEHGSINDSSIEQAIELVQGEYNTPIAKPKKKRTSSSKISKIELELTEQLQASSKQINELKTQCDLLSQERQQEHQQQQKFRTQLEERLAAAEEALSQLVEERNQYKLECERLKAQLEENLDLKAENVPQAEQLDYQQGEYVLPLSLYQLSEEKKQQGIELEFREECGNLSVHYRGDCLLSVKLPEDEDQEVKLTAKFSQVIAQIIPPIILEAIGEAALKGVYLNCWAEIEGFWIDPHPIKEGQQQWFINPIAAAVAIQKLSR